MEGGGRRERAPAKRRREDPPAVDEPSPDELLPVPTDGGLAGSLDRAEEPLCRLGIIADIQYASTRDDTGTSFWGRARHYRDGPRKLERAVAAWHDAGCAAVLNLGDTIDRSTGNPTSDLQSVLDGFARFTELGSTRTAGGVGPPVCHVFGNHEASSVPRSELVPMLRLPASEHIPTEQGAAYYDVRFGPSTPQNNYGGCAPELLPAAGIHEAGPSSPPTVRLVALDTYDVSTAGWPEGHPKRAAAAAMLATGRAAREEPFLDHPELNGGVGPEQLAWLETVLADAAAVGEMVVVFSHAPLYPPVSMDGYAVCWNHAEVRAVLRDAGPTVVLCLSGHDHEGAMRVEWVPAGDPTHAICHLCLEAALEAPVGEECHGVLEIFEDKLIVRGAGGVKDRYMQIWRKDRSPPASDAPDAPDAAAASQSQ